FHGSLLLLFSLSSHFSPSQKNDAHPLRWWGVTKLVSSTILSDERKQQESKQATLESASQYSNAHFIEANVSYLERMDGPSRPSIRCRQQADRQRLPPRFLRSARLTSACACLSARPSTSWPLSVLRHAKPSSSCG